MGQTERILNALRMGVIPEGSIGSFMVSRDAEQREIDNYIEGVASGESRVKFIRGAYGSGKTFLLKYMTEMALENNFIVANVPIHSGFGFSKFDGVYTNMMSNLIVKHGSESSTSFEMIFDDWIGELRSGGNLSSATQNIYKVIQELADYNSSFASVLLVYIRALINRDYELTSTAASWIKGDKNMPFHLKKKLNVKGSIDRENALDIFKGFVRMVHLLGYSGLIIAFDEAEVMMQQRADIRLKAYSNIRQLIDSAGAGEFANAGFMFAGTDEFFEDEEKGLKSYQAIYQRLGENLGGGKRLDNARQPVINIEAFTKNDYKLLSEKVLAVHEDGFGYVFEGDIDHLVNLTMLECTKQLQGKVLTTRVYLKKFIELLDLMQDNPDLPIFRAMKGRVVRVRESASEVDKHLNWLKEL